MTMLEDELAELADPSLHEPVRFTVEEWRKMERDCEEERWGFCMRCGGHDHYAKDCNESPACCPDFPMPRKVMA